MSKSCQVMQRPDTMTVRDAMALLGVSASTLQALMREGRIGFYNKGRPGRRPHRLPLRESVQAYMRSQLSPAVALPV